MTTFHDASALVQRYVPGPGSTLVREIEDRVVVSDLSLVEVPAAIWRKQRAGEVSHEDAALLVAAFGYDVRGGTFDPPLFASVALVPGVLERAIDLLPRHGLSGGEAVQLASALTARSALEFCDTFVAFDDRLRNAAAAEGFTPFPPDADLPGLS